MSISNIRETEAGILFLPRKDAETEAYMDAHFTRVIPGELQWVRKPTVIQKAKSLAIALTSGKADDELFQERLAVCKGCKGLREAEGKIFCGLCGCGRTHLAELNFKLKLKKVRCPLRLF